MYTSAFVSNDAKYWFRAASELLKEDEPGTLLVYTPWHMASVWKSALESIGEEVAYRESEKIKVMSTTYSQYQRLGNLSPGDVM